MTTNIQQELKVQLMVFLSRIPENKMPMVLTNVADNDSLEDGFRQMSIGEIQELATLLPDDAIQILINSSSLENSIKQQKINAHERNQAEKLIRAGASYPVMNALFGLTSKDVSRLRQQLKINNVNGRPAALLDSQQILVKNMWFKSRNGNYKPSERLLNIHERTQLPVNMLWEAIKTII